MEHVLDADEIHAFVAEVFPQAVGFCRITAVGEGQLSVALEAGDDHLRPGGTVSGPTLMTLADTAMYYLVLSLVGREALTVTSQLNISFLRRPRPGVTTATASLLKLGRRLAVGDVRVYSEGLEAPVAQATVTYARAVEG